MPAETERITSDVVVVGAGPVGMTAALLLAARGLDVTLLEKNATTSDAPKAISLDDESLRVCQEAGIVAEVLAAIVPGTGTKYFGSDGRPLFHGRAPIPYRFGYPFKNPFAQPDLERILGQAIARNPRIRVDFGQDVTSLHDLGTHVRVVSTPTSGALKAGITVDASYVIGADGGRSFVRTAAGITMSGTSFPDVWLVADTLGDNRTERYGMHHANPERPHVVVPGLDGRCRYEFRLFEGEGEPGEEPRFDLIRTLLAPLETYSSIASRTTSDMLLRCI